MSNGTPHTNGFARDPEDFFAETRMSFGSHLEELRRHLWLAIAGLIFFLGIGFVLDGIGYFTDWHIFGVQFGFGVPLTKIMQAPVEKALRDYDNRQFAKAKKDAAIPGTEAAIANTPREVRQTWTPEAVEALTGRNVQEPIDINIEMRPLDMEEALRDFRLVSRPHTLSTLSVQEALVVYFKVSLVGGLVIASPWVFFQIWSFVAAGLYPHEKKLVHVYLPFSIFLFIAGALVCQFLVMPKAVEAMLWFNEWLGMTPDLRLNEWLSFAIWMPVVFGISFQTPLVMLFMGKLGIVDASWFSGKRKYAIFIICVFAAVITPSPDAISMMFLAGPMYLLYELGIIMIRLQPPSPFEEEEETTDEMIEV